MKLENLVAKYLATKAAATDAEREYKEAEAALKAAMGELETRDVYVHKVWFTIVYKEKKGAERIDGKALKADLPEIYARYMKRAAASRPISVKTK